MYKAATASARCCSQSDWTHEVNRTCAAYRTLSPTAWRPLNLSNSSIVGIATAGEPTASRLTTDEMGRASDDLLRSHTVHSQSCRRARFADDRATWADSLTSRDDCRGPADPQQHNPYYRPMTAGAGGRTVNSIVAVFQRLSIASCEDDALSYSRT